MAQKRYLAPWSRSAAATREVAPDKAGREVLEALEGKPALYHCVSRVVDRTFRLGPPEKERFVTLMRAWEAFCQVRVLTFCVMSNHFHILVEVPERPAADPTDGELLDHLAILYRGQRLAAIRWELEQHRKQGNHEAAEALRQRFLRRMWDLSAFMKALKQDFSTWFNQRHERKGHLWEERFKSVLQERAGGGWPRGAGGGGLHRPEPGEGGDGAGAGGLPLGWLRGGGCGQTEGPGGPETGDARAGTGQGGRGSGVARGGGRRKAEGGSFLPDDPADGRIPPSAKGKGKAGPDGGGTTGADAGTVLRGWVGDRIGGFC